MSCSHVAISKDDDSNALKKFLKDVAWPALAGNVAWAFFTLAIDPPCRENITPRLGALLFLALYLTAEWYRSSKTDTTLLGLWLDLFLVFCFVWFAIATQANAGSANLALLLILLAVGIGHCCGAWPPFKKDNANRFFGLTCLSMTALMFVSAVFGFLSPWIAFIVIIIVLITWKYFRGSETK